ncbi:hypothetical protein K435DRAFT_629209, partial [Dendrothele bispora CBS 962.96]
LPGGRGLMVFRTPEEVRWLVENDMLDGLAAAMGENISVRPNVFEVVVEFVPVSAQIETEEGRSDIAEVNGLDEKSIVTARWIKPVERRHSKQTVAHAMFLFTDRESANRMIREGMVVNGKQLMVRKSEIDIVQCVKCRGEGHFAADCRSDKVVCGRCKESHRTAECTAGENDLWCVKCGAAGHGAADRNCPMHRRKVEEKKARDPEVKYKYFITDDAATW